MSLRPTSLFSFVLSQRVLLQLERDAELEQARDRVERADKDDLCKKGVLVAKLCVASTRTGMYGRTMVELQREREQTMPANNLTTGEREERISSIKVLKVPP
jgi:hypothetical protein